MAEPESLRCTACGATTPISEMPSICGHCRGILDVQYPDAIERPPAAEGSGIWRWAGYLPRCTLENRISLGEAESPLMRCDTLAHRLGLSDLWIKNDAIMPTGSFKDRAMALTVSLARAYRSAGLILSSSGNAGASGAAYAARAGLHILVLVPAHTPEAKLRQIALCGATLVTVDGATSDTCGMVERLARDHGLTNVTTTFHNPYGVEAYATLAYETANLEPDVVLLPIASGPLLVGMMKGYHRLKARGAISRVPRPVAVQAANCAPIARAFDGDCRVAPWEHQDSVASALNDTLAGYERDGDHTIDCIKQHGGCAIAVDEDEIVGAVRDLAGSEGIVAEPSAAVPVAAVKHLLKRELIRADERVLVVATGHGLKDLSCAPSASRATASPAEIDALARELAESPRSGRL